MIERRILAMTVLVMIYMTVMNCGIQRHLYYIEGKIPDRAPACGNK